MNSRKAVAYVVMAVVVAFTLFPVYWVISTSFKPPSEWFAQPVHWLPRNPTLSNYETTYATTAGFKVIFNSLIVALGSTALALFIGYPAAYAISRHGTGRFALFLVPLILRASPPMVIALPLLVFYSSVGLLDTAQGLILVYAATTVFYIIWMIKPFIHAVPRDLEDAAMVDGVPRWSIPFKVILPTIAGGVVTSTIFVFILNWTEFSLALALTMNQVRTIPIQMMTISGLGGDSQGHGQAAALSTVSLVPFILGAYFLQKQLLRNLFLGIVRG